MMNPSKEINLGESLSPWDYEKQAQESEDRKEVATKKKSFKSKTGNERTETSISRAVTTNKPFPKKIMQLQKRVPTEIILFTQKKQQQKLTCVQPQKRQLLLKLPLNFKTIPPKKTLEKGLKTGPLSHREVATSRQRISARNLKQQIEQLHKLHKIGNSHERQNSSITKNSKFDYDIIKKCSLKNVRMFEQQKNAGENNIFKLKKVMTQGKKHVLDRILSKFQL